MWNGEDSLTEDLRSPERERCMTIRAAGSVTLRWESANFVTNIHGDSTAQVQICTVGIISHEYKLLDMHSK
jgi:hypothetical protein